MAEKREINLENELECILQWKRDSVMSPTPARGMTPDDALFLFSVGLLCGVKNEKEKEKAAVATGDSPLCIDEGALRQAEFEMKRDAAKAAERRRPKDWENGQTCPEMPNRSVGGTENARIRPCDEALKDPGIGGHL